MQRDRPIVLSVAGFDPCAGAGILADIKTFEQLKVMGMSVVTAQTIQTEELVLRVDWQPIEIVLQGIQTLMQRYRIPAVKIGLVKDFDYLKSIIDCIKTQNSNAFIVWDPVMKSSSGVDFFDKSDLYKLKATFDIIELITPNYDEYISLKPYLDVVDSTAVLIKGGHRHDNVGLDILHAGNSVMQFQPSVDWVYPKHGSGCVLSAAITAHVASEKTVEQACRLAKSYVEYFLNSHPTLLGYHNNAK